MGPRKTTAAQKKRARRIDAARNPVAQARTAIAQGVPPADFRSRLAAHLDAREDDSHVESRKDVKFQLGAMHRAMIEDDEPLSDVARPVEPDALDENAVLNKALTTLFTVAQKRAEGIALAIEGRRPEDAGGRGWARTKFDDPSGGVVTAGHGPLGELPKRGRRDNSGEQYIPNPDDDWPDVPSHDSSAGLVDPLQTLPQPKGESGGTYSPEWWRSRAGVNRMVAMMWGHYYSDSGSGDDIARGA